MSKINQIERALQEIDATKFHKLVDSYLSKAYRYHIVSNGTKTAEDKPVKGTPDSFVLLENRKYVFIEYTTQKTNIVNKFIKDLVKCFDKDKTAISITSIEKVILACNSDLAPDEIKNLKDKCLEHNIDCTILGNSTIANELFSRYPSISNDFLGISVDSGQILDYEDFIKNYDTNKYSTSLNTLLQCREKEFDDLYADIGNSNIVLVTGVAGIGKTKLALEVCQTYAEKNNYQFKAILNRGVNIFEDMRSYFNEEGESYLVLIDDVNRIHTALNYIQEYYGNKFENGSLRIVATVREYAKEKIIQMIPYKLISKEYELHALKDEFIKKIVSDEYDIHNTLYLERISEVASGNPRLALMAASVAKEQDSLESIYDVTSIYDEYFSNIKEDIEAFNHDNMLLTIVVVSFFRVIDRSNRHQVELIENAFNISIDELWKCIEELNDLEIFDLYENEVVKVSDQILSTYLFYKIVFVDKKIPIDIFLEHFFPQYKHKVVEVLNPLLSTFDSKYIIDVLKEPVNKIWDKYLKDESSLYDVMSVFWFLKQTDILIYFKNKIDNLEVEKIDIENIDFWVRSNTNQLNDVILEKLSLFKYDTSQSIEMAVELILMYLEKQLSKLKEILYVLTENYGYVYENYRYGYEKEQLLLNTIWAKCNNGENKLISKLYIQICSEFLKTEFDDNKYKNNQFILQNFKLYDTDELALLRKNIFENLDTLYEKKEYQKDIIQLIKKYPDCISYRFGISEIENRDSENIIEFVQKHFDSTIYEHVKVVNECLDAFDKHEIKYEEKIRNQFSHPTQELAKIMNIDDVDISLETPRDKEENTNWDEIKQIKQNRLAKYIENYSLSDWENLFERCHEFYTHESGDYYRFENNLQDLFQILYEKDKSLYIQVFEKYLEFGNQFNITLNLVHLIDLIGKETTYNLIQKYDFNSKDLWLFNFFQVLPEELIEKDDIKTIIEFYKNIEINFIPNHFGYLKKYYLLDNNIFISISKILLERADSENINFIYKMAMIFNSFSDIFLNMEEYYKDDIDLLKHIYLLLCITKRNHFDYDNKSLNKLLNLDAGFLEVYVDKILENKEYIYSRDIQGDFTILWSRDDYETIFSNLIEFFFSMLEKKKIWRGGEVLKGLFSYKKGNKDIQERINNVIKKYIDDFYSDGNRMKFIFQLIAEFSDERRLDFISYFINKNDYFEIFKKLSLEPSVKSWSGSRVPYLQKDKDFYNSLFQNLNGIKFLQHKQYIEEKILYIEKDIKNQKKIDFMDDY